MNTNLSLVQQVGSTDSFDESDILWLLKLRGYTVNRQRLAFVSAVCDLKTIESPEELWLYLIRKNSKISIAAIYYNLKMMIKEKFMIKVPRPGRCCGYELLRKDQIDMKAVPRLRVNCRHQRMYKR